mgnify:CR=1 FL=1
MSIRLALAGNPNCGKTTMFNDLTGATQYVGNWPGVTVEKKEGKFKGDKEVLITDLPGIYSLSPYTLEEVVARDYLVNEKPQAIMNLVDASNIERNLYLTTQLLEMGIPVVIALNMMDEMRANGNTVDVNKLEEELGVQLFHRSRYHIVLTDEGMLLRRRAQEIVELAEKTARELRPAEEGTGRISIGSGDLRIVGDGVGRAFFERFGDETVAVEGIAPQGEEDGVRLDPARVGRDTGVLAEKFV